MKQRKSKAVKPEKPLQPETSDLNTLFESNIKKRIPRKRSKYSLIPIFELFSERLDNPISSVSILVSPADERNTRRLRSIKQTFLTSALLYYGIALFGVILMYPGLSVLTVIFGEALAVGFMLMAVFAQSLEIGPDVVDTIYEKNQFVHQIFVSVGDRIMEEGQMVKGFKFILNFNQKVGMEFIDDTEQIKAVFQAHKQEECEIFELNLREVLTWGAVRESIAKICDQPYNVLHWNCQDLAKYVSRFVMEKTNSKNSAESLSHSQCAQISTQND